MKKLLMLIVLIIAIGAQAQVPIEITEDVDEFTGKVSYNLNQVCTFKKEGKAEMVLLPNLASAHKIEFLGALAAGIGCIENAQIYILFEDGEVINSRMFNKFNCDGLAGFRLNKKEWDMLATKKIAKVKLSNKGKTIVGEPDNPEYFITVFNLLK